VRGGNVCSRLHDVCVLSSAQEERMGQQRDCLRVQRYVNHGSWVMVWMILLTV
jgi:hypothetical protein